MSCRNGLLIHCALLLTVLLSADVFAARVVVNPNAPKKKVEVKKAAPAEAAAAAPATKKPRTVSVKKVEPMPEPVVAPPPPVPVPVVETKPDPGPPAVQVAPLAPPPPPKPEPRLVNKDKGGKKTRVAVMDLKGSEGISVDMLNALSALISETLEGLGPFKAITTQDIQQMLALEERKQSLGCSSDSACIAEIGGALGADYMVNGSVLVADGTYVLQLQLSNVKKARVEQRVTRDVTGQQRQLLEDTRVATKLLVRDILSQRSGWIALTTGVEGATVKLDGTIIGVTPLNTFAASGGMHTLVVEREGFIAATRDVEVTEQQTAQVNVVMQPSEDFRRAYSARAGRTRALAWTFLGVGVAGLGVGATFLALSVTSASQLRRDIVAYNDSELKTNAAYDRINQRKSQLGTYDTLALVLAGVGVASLTTSIILFATGDDPHALEAKVEVGGVSMTLQPSLGGAAVAGSF